MTTTTRFLQTLAVVMALGAGATAAADTRWYQVPARPAWVEVGPDWTVAADASKSLLNARHERGGRLMLLADAEASPEALSERLQKLIEAEYPDAALTAGGGGFAGKVTVGAAPLEVRALARRVEGADTAVSLAVAAVAPRSQAPAAWKAGQAALGSARSQWERPGGATLAVGDTGLTLRQPEAGWQVVRTAGQPDGLRTPDTLGELQITISRGPRHDPDSVIDRYARGLGAALGLAWEDTAPWKPAEAGKEVAATGRQRRGTAMVGPEGQQVRYHALLRSLRLADGSVVLLIGTGQGEQADTFIEQIEAITAAIKPRP